MIPRTCVQSPQRLKASYERQAHIQRLSSTFSPGEVRGGLGKTHVACTLWVSPSRHIKEQVCKALSTKDGPKEAVSKRKEPAVG